MKKFYFLTTILLVVRIATYSQITLDFQSPLMSLIPIKLTNSETKYYLADPTSIFQNNAFSLYNLDGSLFKIIQMPAKPDSLQGIFGPYLISRSLFDNDPSNIEYIIQYNYDSVPFYQIRESKVIREDGTILLDEKYGSISMSPGWVYATEEGTKLMLSPYNYANGTPCEYITKVFNLPGELPTNFEDKSQLAPSLMLFPNPNNGSFYIKFNSNVSTDHQIDLYSTNGKLIDTYQSSGNPTHISNFGLSDGMYLISTRSKRMNSTTKMLIKK